MSSAAEAVSSLKRALRQRLTERQWEQLFYLKTLVSPGSLRHRASQLAKSSVANLCMHLARLLPLREAVDLKERIKRVEKLDCPFCDIYLNLDSSAELIRTESCKKEPETVEWIRTHMRPGDVFYDIGANVGAYSLVAYAATAGNSMIYAFEPSFSTFASLCQNVILNQCEESIIPLNVALAHETKLVSLHYSSIASGVAMHGLGKSIDEYGKPFQPAAIQPVLAYRLDDLVQHFALRPANHIKIDIDGDDLNVLRGAEKILTTPTLRSLLIEVDEDIYPHDEVTRFLTSRGFRFMSKYPRVRPRLFNCIFEK